MQKNELNVQLFDAREPLMQPNSGGLNPDNDYLHFCMNSAAINIYLDMYWTEVFSTHVVNEAAVCSSVVSLYLVEKFDSPSF